MSVSTLKRSIKDANIQVVILAIKCNERPNKGTGKLELKNRAVSGNSKTTNNPGEWCYYCHDDYAGYRQKIPALSQLSENILPEKSGRWSITKKLILKRYVDTPKM